MVVQTGNTLQRPPRLTGDQQGDLRALQRWMSDLYNALVLSGNIIGTQDDQEERIQALETFVFPPGYSFEAQGFTVDPTGKTIIGTNQITLNPNGQTTIGDSDFRRIQIFEDTGNSAVSGPRTFRVRRVGSDATVGSNTNLVVNKTTWVLTNTTAPAGIRMTTLSSAGAGPGVDPGEVWALTGIVDTYASSASNAAVAIYGQGVRRGLPSSGVGVALLAGVIEATSLTGAASSVDGQIRGLEIDIKANGPDDFPGVGREMLSLIIANGDGVSADPHVTSIIGVYPVPGVSPTITYGFRINSITWEGALIDGRGGAEGASANTVWLKTGQHIALDTAANTRLSSDATTITLDGEIKVGAAGAFSANGAVATSLTGVGPAGANTTVQEWLEITNNSGTKRYIPCF